MAKGDRTALDPLNYLSALEQFGIKLGLDNIWAIVEALDHPERAFRSVHIAGTNGKGSVTAMADAALRAAGHRSARYTSPHLVDLAERFVIDGKPVDRGALTAALADLQAIVDRLLAERTLQVPPTYFEATTATAFELFRRANVDIAVCEVGLGGRLDATNVLQPVATAITTIGLDHERHLGASLREIAAEKAGIIKPGVPVVVGNLPAEAMEKIEEVARDRGAEIIQASSGTEVVHLEKRSHPLFDANTQKRGTTPFPEDGQAVLLKTPRHDYGEVSLALAGAHQIDNATVAVRLLETLDALGIFVPPEAITLGLARVEWPGRLERRRLSDGREALLDAAHNPDGAAALAAFLHENVGAGPIVFGASSDKDITGMLRALTPVTTTFVFTRASNVRSADPIDLAARAREVAPNMPVTISRTPHDALADAWRLSPRIVVAGSIFLIAEVMNEIGTS